MIPLQAVIHHEPKGTKFYSHTLKKKMMLASDGEWKGWLLYLHPDGQWVSLRKATDEDVTELAQAVSNYHHRVHHGAPRKTRKKK